MAPSSGQLVPSTEPLHRGTSTPRRWFTPCRIAPLSRADAASPRCKGLEVEPLSSLDRKKSEYRRQSPIRRSSWLVMIL